MIRAAILLGLALLALLPATRAAFAREPDALEFERAYRESIAGSTAQAAAATDTDSAALRGYVLYPYLELARFRRILGDPKLATEQVDDRIAAFLVAHDREVVAQELRRVWYPLLVQRMDWGRLLENYRDIGDPNIQCQTLTARLRIRRTEGLQADALSTWLTAADSRQACEPVFTWLKSQDLLTDESIAKRARLALAQNNPAFARQLIAMLPESLRDPLLDWAQLIERPRNGIDAAISSPARALDADALLDGWIRLARNDMNGAMERFDKLVQARKLPPKFANRLAMELALALSWSRRPEALKYFALVPNNELDDRGAEWNARAALWAGQWQRAGTVIDAMPDNLRQQTKWRYWSGRVLELQGQRTNAQKLYNTLQSDDNYYAALAAARLGKPYAPNPIPIAVNEQQVAALAQLPPLQRAHALLTSNIDALRDYAYDEWRKAYYSLDAANRKQTVVLASRWDWHDQAILTAAQQGMFDDYALLYPHPFDSVVHDAAARVNLPENLLYGLIRQESVYRADAQSIAGAIGLTQLVPGTAARAARRWPELAKQLLDPKNLTDPTTNIYLGAAQLRDLIDRSSDLIPVALASYNAGPGASRRWLPNAKMDADIWIENIPYNETRVYVQRIFWHSVVFGWVRTGKGQDTTGWLQTVGPQ